MIIKIQRLFILLIFCLQDFYCDAALIFSNKLVRDKIPEIIESEGRICNIYQVEGAALKRKLLEKLQEEITEFTFEPSIEEMADILEVLYGLCEAYDLPLNAIEETRKDKLRTKGGFEKGVVMYSCEEQTAS